MLLSSTATSHRPPNLPPPAAAFRCHLMPLLIVKCAFFPPHATPSPLIYPTHSQYCVHKKNQDKALCGVVRSAHQPHGLCPNQALAVSPMVYGWCLCAWLGRPKATGNGMGQSCWTPWLTSIMSIIYSHEGVLDLLRLYVGYCRFSFHANKIRLNTYPKRAEESWLKIWIRLCPHRNWY